MECDEIGKLHNSLSSNLELLLDSGFHNPVTNVKLCDKQQILKAMALHSVTFTAAAELPQFRDGIYKVKIVWNHFTATLIYPFCRDNLFVLISLLFHR